MSLGCANTLRFLRLSRTFPSYLRLHSISPRFHNQENRRRTRDHTCTVSPVEETNFKRGKFQSLLDNRYHASGLRRISVVPRFATDPFFSVRRREFPFLVDRSRRSPCTRRDLIHSLPFALLGHAATAVRHNKPRRFKPLVQCTPLFLPLHVGLRTRRSVKRSISFGNHAGRASRRPLERPNLSNRFFRRSQRDASVTASREIFFQRVLDLNLKLNFLPLGIFFQLFSRELKLRFFFS